MKIGFLWPADGLNDSEYLKFLPEGLSWYVQRYNADTDSEELIADVLIAYADPENLASAASNLLTIKPDIFLSADHAACIVASQNGEKSMAQAVTKATGIFCITIGKAIHDALNFIGAKKISVLSPYSESITLQLIKTLEIAGFSIVAKISINANSEDDIGSKNSAYWWKPLIDLVNSSDYRPDAVLLAGGGVCFASSIERYEAETGIPVITAPGALIWAAIQKLGLNGYRFGLGKLFRPPPSRPQKRLAALQSTGTKSFSLTKKPPIFIAGSGTYLIDENGKAFIDFACGSGTSALGHGHPNIQKALDTQIRSGVTHLGPHFHAPIQSELYEQLAKVLPKELSRFHPAVSGSEATEVAIKAAMHSTGNKKFMSFTGSYHGRTFGALSVSGNKGKNQILEPFKPETLILPFPDTPNRGYEAAEQISSDLAGVIIEPIQATAGLNQADFDGLSALASEARVKNVPLIFDEVFTGFGRTGALFAFDHYNLIPDLLIVGKSFGGGLPAGLVAGTESILGRLEIGTQSSTFQLQPMAAATASAFLKIFLQKNMLTYCRNIEQWCREEFKALEENPHVIELRGVGAFWVLKIADQRKAKFLRRIALENGLLTWECGEQGKDIGLVPPLTVERHHIKQAAKILDIALTT